MSEQPKYPDVEVQLSGEDGNAFMIIGRTMAALRRGGVPAKERDRYAEEATSGDYDNVLTTTLRWVNVA